jgi:hypothetical protein
MVSGEIPEQAAKSQALRAGMKHPLLNPAKEEENAINRRAKEGAR